MSVVNILVTSDDVVPVPQAGVSVSIIDPATQYALIARVTTNAQGIAGFDIPDGTYEVRAYKRGIIFQPPSAIQVAGPGAYTLTGVLLSIPVATDPRLCRCTGRFVNYSNSPMGGVTVIISVAGETGFQVPKVVDGQAVISSSRTLKTNSDGYVSVDLIRGGQYDVTFSGDDDSLWPIKVPDRASANLIDLIHPQPVALAWDPTKAPGNAVSLAVGATLEVPLSLLFSDFETLTTGVSRWLDFSNSAAEIAGAELLDGAVATLSLRGITTGTAQVTAAVKTGLVPARVPDYSLTAPPLVVTVTP